MKVSDPGASVCHCSICAIVSLLVAMSDERDVLWYDKLTKQFQANSYQ